MCKNTTTIIWWRERPVWILLFMGFSAGLPLMLIFATLSVWLREAGISRSAVTFFSWAALGYSFKFVWAPLVDKLPLPILTHTLGCRRSWLLLSQICVAGSIVCMALIDPQHNVAAMAYATVFLGFSAATQDIAIDAYRIESAPARLQAILSSTYIAGYRGMGMILGGAGALYLAQYFGSDNQRYLYSAWRNTYFIMAALMLISIITTLLIQEPKNTNRQSRYPFQPKEYAVFFLVFMLSVIAFVITYILFSHSSQNPLIQFILGVVKMITALAAAIATAWLCVKLGMINRQLFKQSYQLPVIKFFSRYGKLALWVLLLIGFYRTSDIVMGVIANVFYLDMGYSKSEIASVSKIFGVLMTVAGSFAGGFLVIRWGVIRILFVGATLAAVTNLLFIVLASSNKEISLLIMVITADNLSAGIATASFIAWLSSLTDLSFTATQYAIFSSIMTLFPKLLGGYSGTIVEHIGYNHFFLMSCVLGLPVIGLIYFLSKRLK